MEENDLFLFKDSVVPKEKVTNSLFFFKFNYTANVSSVNRRANVVQLISLCVHFCIPTKS